MFRMVCARGLVVAGVVMALLYARPAAGEQRAVDLTAPESVRLKATLFSGSAPGPGVLLLHRCNRQRAIWDGLGQKLKLLGGPQR